jgi:hypothetical protein
VNYGKFELGKLGGRATPENKLTTTTRIYPQTHILFEMTRKQNNKRKNNNKRMGNRRGFTTQPKINDIGFGVPITTTASLASLVAIPEGTGINQRIGNRIYPNSLQIKATLNASTTIIGSAVASIRLMVVQDLQQVQGTAPLITDIINPSSVVGQRNLYFMQRFKILRDIKIKVDTYNPTINYNDRIRLNSYIGFASGTSTDLSRNGIYLIYVSDNSGNPPNMVWSSRLYYAN